MMIYLFIFLFVISVIVIIIQRIWIRKLLFGINNLIIFIDDIKNVIVDFDNHLTAFNATDVYMGDPIVEDLIKHSKFASDKLKEISGGLENIVEEK